MNNILRPPRKYQGIWNQLKRTGECTLSASPVFHKRIIKAVFKERNKDQAWGLEIAERGIRMRLRAISNFALLKFTLRKADSLNVEDL